MNCETLGHVWEPTSRGVAVGFFECTVCDAVGRIVEIDTDCDEFTDEEWQAFEERM